METVAGGLAGGSRRLGIPDLPIEWCVLDMYTREGRVNCPCEL